MFDNILKNITVEECERIYKKGWCSILNDGKVKGFYKENKKEIKQSLHNKTFKN